jgi:hypothetical protein
MCEHLRMRREEELSKESKRLRQWCQWGDYSFCTKFSESSILNKNTNRCLSVMVLFLQWCFLCHLIEDCFLSNFIHLFEKIIYMIEIFKGIQWQVFSLLSISNQCHQVNVTTYLLILHKWQHTYHPTTFFFLNIMIFWNLFHVW